MRVAERRARATARLVLGIDTCGPAGSVALARLDGRRMDLLAARTLEGRSYSATLVKAVEELLAEVGFRAAALDAIAVTSGPGSFTGVRVGLSAAKGLAEALQIPVVAVSRLEVLAAKARTESAALDAHRSQVFLRLAQPEGAARELLAGAEELAELSKAAELVASSFASPVTSPVAVCEDAAAELLAKLWPGAELKRVEAPTAADVMRMAAGRVEVDAFDEVALLDGHYLRRSDAEIFGQQAEERRGG